MVQPEGGRGSLKWIQRAVNGNAAVIDREILPRAPGSTRIIWSSPLANDDYSEYRDAAFLERVGLSGLSTALAEFWPSRGPQWDALGTTDSGVVLLVEAKAHLEEVFSPASQAGQASLVRIKSALQETADHLGAVPLAPWHLTFYQLANRLAHLHFLRRNGVDARLVLVSFVGDNNIGGPETAAEWEAAYAVIWYVLGLAKRHALVPHIIHAFPDVRELT